MNNPSKELKARRKFPDCPLPRCIRIFMREMFMPLSRDEADYLCQDAQRRVRHDAMVTVGNRHGLNDYDYFVGQAWCVKAWDAFPGHGINVETLAECRDDALLDTPLIVVDTPLSELCYLMGKEGRDRDERRALADSIQRFGSALFQFDFPDTGKTIKFHPFITTLTDVEQDHLIAGIHPLALHGLTANPTIAKAQLTDTLRLMHPMARIVYSRVSMEMRPGGITFIDLDDMFRRFWILHPCLVEFDDESRVELREAIMEFNRIGWTACEAGKNRYLLMRPTND